MTYSHTHEAHYHRRGCVSLPSSGWDRVFRSCCGHQTVKETISEAFARVVQDAFGGTAIVPSTGSNQANRAISTGQLNALLHLHLRPIDVVVFHGSQGIPCFEGGFTLRCLQRLSCPFMATLHCRWHDNRSTSGTFTPVLSY